LSLGTSAVGKINLSLLKNLFGPARERPLIAADDFHQVRGKSGDGCDLSAMHGDSVSQHI
jgi:hypothetical protein